MACREKKLAFRLKGKTYGKGWQASPQIDEEDIKKQEHILQTRMSSLWLGPASHWWDLFFWNISKFTVTDSNLGKKQTPMQQQNKNNSAAISCRKSFGVLGISCHPLAKILSPETKLMCCVWSWVFVVSFRGREGAAFWANFHTLSKKW